MLHAARWKYRTQKCRKNDSKIRHLRTIAQLCQAISSQLRHISTVGKNMLSSNMSSRCLHNMVNFGLLTAEMMRSFREFGATQQISTAFASWFTAASDVAHRRPTKLCTMFGRLLAATLYIHFRGLLPPDGILPGAKLTLCPPLAFSYIVSVTTRHSSSGRQPKFAACY